MTKTNILIWGALFLAMMWYVLVFIPKIDERRMKLYEPVSNIEITAEEINLDGYLSNEQLAIEVATETVRIEKKPVVVKTSPVVKEKPVILTTEEPKLKEVLVVEEKPVVNLDEIDSWNIKAYLHEQRDSTVVYRMEGQPIKKDGTGTPIKRCVAHVTHYTGYKFDIEAKSFERGYEIEVNKNYDFTIECFAGEQSTIVK